MYAVSTSVPGPCVCTLCFTTAERLELEPISSSAYETACGDATTLAVPPVTDQPVRLASKPGLMIELATPASAGGGGGGGGAPASTGSEPPLMSNARSSASLYEPTVQLLAEP